MDAQELLRRYAGGQRDFSYADLHQVDLSHQTLPGIGLTQANLTGANLVGTDLQMANLRQANLTGANLAGANLTAANLRRANLTAAHLDDVQLEQAVLLGAILPDGTVVEPMPLSTAADQPASAWAMPEHPVAEHPVTEHPVTKYSVTEHPVTEHPVGHPGTSAVGVASPLPSDVPGRPQSLQDFKTHLPWASLGCLGMSYLCFGILLGMHNATLVLWAIALFSALLWRIDEALTLCMPLVGGLTVVLTDWSSLLAVWGLGWAAIATLSTSLSFKIFMDRSWLMALRDGCVVGGSLAIVIKAYIWMLASQGNYSWGPIYAPEWTSAHLSLLLIAGVVGGGLGAIAWMQMQSARFSLRQITVSYLLIAAIGLLLGRLVTLFGTLSP